MAWMTTWTTAWASYGNSSLGWTWTRTQNSGSLLRAGSTTLPATTSAPRSALPPGSSGVTFGPWHLQLLAYLFLEAMQQCVEIREGRYCRDGALVGHRRAAAAKLKSAVDCSHRHLLTSPITAPHPDH